MYSFPILFQSNHTACSSLCQYCFRELLIFSTSVKELCGKVKKKTDDSHKVRAVMKIYNFDGKNNISGERVREARVRLRMTQEKLAVQLKLAHVEIERDSISRIELGTRFVTDYEILALSKVLKVSPSWLLGIDDSH